MNEMIERVARTLSPQSWEALDTPCDTKAKKKRREVSLDYARRCIKVMRDPTNDMIADPDLPYSPTEMRDYWQAMIDKALENE